MINFSDNKMSFLTSEGTETVIDKNVIWDISFKKHDRSIPFKNKDDEIPIRFVHPYPFAGCENEEKVGLRQIFPQHLLEDPLLIKAELERLHQGFEALEVNVREKVFYPEPQVFTNISTLSIWGNLNLRYGSSTTRNSSFVPAIRSELSEGLYKYQRVTRQRCRQRCRNSRIHLYSRTVISHARCEHVVGQQSVYASTCHIAGESGCHIRSHRCRVTIGTKVDRKYTIGNTKW